MSKRIGGICKDGTYTNATGRGAGSHHGGIAQWIYADSGSTGNLGGYSTPSFGGGSSNYYTSYSKKKQQKIQTQKQKQLKKTIDDLNTKFQELQKEKDKEKKKFQQYQRQWYTHYKEQQCIIKRIKTQNSNLFQEKRTIQVENKKLKQNEEILKNQKHEQKQKYQNAFKIMNQKLITLESNLKQKDQLLKKIQTEKLNYQKYKKTQKQIKQNISNIYKNQIGLLKYHHDKELKNKNQKINLLSQDKNNLNVEICFLKEQIKKLKQIQNIQKRQSQVKIKQKLQQLKTKLQKNHQNQIIIIKENHLKQLQCLNQKNNQQVSKLTHEKMQLLNQHKKDLKEQEKSFLLRLQLNEQTWKIRLQEFKSQPIVPLPSFNQQHIKEMVDKETLTNEIIIPYYPQILNSQIDQNKDQSPLFSKFFVYFILLWVVYVVKKLYQLLDLSLRV